MGVKTKYIEWIAQNVTTYNDLNICHTVNDNSIILLLAITTIQIRQTVYCVHYLSASEMTYIVSSGALNSTHYYYYSHARQIYKQFSQTICCRVETKNKKL